MSGSHPKLSIITVCFNSAKTIEHTIKSVISQGYDALEYIIVDGGSTDGTLEIIKKYSSHISQWISEKDEGISDAFNKGIRLATGEIVGIINSDDRYIDGAFKALISAYDESVDIYRGNIILWNMETGGQVREAPTIGMPLSGWKINVCHQGVFIRKDAYERYGLFDTVLKYNMDLDLLLRFEHAGARSKYIDYDMAYFTMSGITFSGFTREQREEMESIIRKNGGSTLDIWRYRMIKYTKMFLKKMIGIDRVLRIKNKVL